MKREKEEAVRAYNKVKCYCKNVHIQRMLGKADDSLNSKSWTKTGHDIIKACKRGPPIEDEKGPRIGDPNEIRPSIPGPRGMAAGL